MIAELSDHAVDHIGLVVFGVVLVIVAGACLIYAIKREYDERARRR